MEIKVLIEIPQGSNVKYEIDEKSWEMTIDRLMPTAMSYPVSYGLIKKTHGEDGDALDALVFLSQPTISGVIVKCNIIGLLEMEDEAGIDHKIVAVPLKKIDPICGSWTSLQDIPQSKKDQIRHFFEHYKDLEPEKWVKLKNWKNATYANKILQKGLKSYKSLNKK